jgi:hypothetical protein
MVAVHNPKMIRDKSRRRAEGTDVLRDHHSALRHRGLQHPLIIDAAQAWPVRR